MGCGVGGMGVWPGVVAHEILVSAQGPLVLGFGAKGLGPGLDNIYSETCITITEPYLMCSLYKVHTCTML